MASTNTSRLGVLKATPGTGEPFDLVRFNADMDKIDLAGNGARVCTSGARPASPYQGMHIWETDTEAHGFWDGEEWQIFDTKYQPYTPVLTAAAGAITLGGGSVLEGWYKRSGSVIDFKIMLKFGTSPNAGTSGAWSMTLPTAAVVKPGGGFNADLNLGTFFGNRANATAGFFTGIMIQNSAIVPPAVGQFNMYVPEFSKTVPIGPVMPAAFWASQDYLRFEGSYEKPQV